ncbi:MAG: GTPase Era [Firmicutes bacterium]|nr:GTPase Era [Bacillota bacterium]MDY3658755.1 GTPase Era [Eubacteriales bacterium]
MKAGYVAIVGRTNAGKSTLINKFLGIKLNIVSAKQQTTRNNVLGVLTENGSQIVFIDTPGIHKSQNALDKFMNKSVRSASEGADVVVYLIDGKKPVSDEEIDNIKKIKEKNENLIVAVSKIDLVQKEKLAENLVKLNEIQASEIVPISSLKKQNLDVLKKAIVSLLPEGDFIFPEDEITDKSTNFLCAEIVREKVLNFTNQEIPHGVMCEVVSFKEKASIIEISIDIICEKDSHKSIIIGKGGTSLKRIGASARIDMEKLLDKKVMLNLYVKVEKDWRNKQNFLIANGYN